MPGYTTAELVTVMASRELEDRKTAFVGAGLPLISAALAQKTHAPDLTIIFEGGAVAPLIHPTLAPYSTNEARATRFALMVSSPSDLFNLLHRGYIDYGFLGGAQIDKYGNINTSVIGDFEHPKVRLPGSGGANDISSLCTKTMIVTHHEKRRFIEKIDFLTSPGYLAGGDSRRAAGLIFGKVDRLVSHLCVMDFDEESGVMRVKKLHPGVTIEDVLENTGFAPLVAEKLETTSPPTERELKILRELDPEGMYVPHA
ncbi:MAG: 3-oxoadipate--succinyl-CoA transferase subunit B [Nitrososphaerota archaeon]|nr:3-oxoadipate--succinyl-CoA transferase subunit B [Nitrososphaerota archaeon]MDG6939228.1 3-oxoadipate--succinyl-CoA transferase subunit B [Nitrososphaerota archaeon]